MRIIKKAIENPAKALNALAYRATLRTLNHWNFKRFIVLSRSRTGSNLLVSYLSNHPNIAVSGEIFAKLNGRKAEDVLSDTFSEQPFFVKARGFKIFYYHPLDDIGVGIWDALVDMPDLHIIHLKRRNILRTVVSRRIAGLNDAWSSTRQPDTNRATSVSFTPDELNELLAETRDWESKGDEMFHNHQKLEICYEDLTDEPKRSFGKIARFLGVKASVPKTRLKKQNPQRLRDLVRNYDELKAAFEGTQWDEMFEE